MKIILLVLLLSSSLSAQNSFDLLFPNTCDCSNSTITKVIETSSQKYIALYNKLPNDLDESIECELITLDYQGKKVASKIFNSDTDYEEWIIDIVEFNGLFFAIGGARKNSDGKISFSIYKLDKNLKVLKKRFLNQKREGFDYIDYAKIKIDKANILFSYNQITPIESYPVVGVIDTTFTNLKLNEFEAKSFFFVSDVGKYKNGDDYLMELFSKKIKLNNNLEIIEEDNLSTPYFFLDRLPYKNKFIGVSREYVWDKNELYRNLAIHHLDNDFKILKTKTLGKPFGNKVDTVDAIFRHGISWKDPNKIFISGVTFKDFNFTSLYNNDTWVLLSQVDSTLKEKWTRYLFGNGAHIVHGVLATSDGGVLIYGNQDTLKTGTPDHAFVMKLNADGILSNKENVQFPDIQIFVGPNPFRSACTFALNLKESNETVWLEVYNSLGQLVKTTILQDGLNPMDFSSFSIGAYAYNVLINNQLVQKGKLIKIE